MAEQATNAEKPVVLITGASSGLGDGMARRFAAEGWRIVAVARRKDRLEALASDLSGITDVAIYAGDVADPETPKKAVQVAKDSFGRLDCLVNNAGSGKWAPVDQTDDAMLEEVLDISLKAPFRFAREAIPLMKPGSSIINIGSTWGITSGMGGGPYTVVKHGLVGLTQTLAVDYGARGIRCNLLAPGVIRTDMTTEYWDSDYFQRTNQELTPFNRDGTVDDVAGAVYFLASKDGSFINGQTIAQDGGWTTTKYLAMDAIAAERVQKAAE